MRALVTPLLLVIVLAGLGGYIYFVEMKKPATAGDTKAKTFDVNAGDIEEIRIALKGGDTTTLKKTDDTWQIVEPVQAKADNSEVSNMASSLASLDVQRVVDEAAADLAPFGLSEPHLEVSFRTKGQTTFRRLLIGEKTPTGGDVYVKQPDSARVFLVSSFVDDTFKRTAFDLRDKTILALERDKITGLTLTSANGTVELVRKGATWTFVTPQKMRADYATLESILTTLISAQLQKYVTDMPTPAELAQYGLARPSATATIISGDSRVTLELGRTDNAETYARASSAPAVVMVAPTIVEDVNRKVEDLRQRDVFDARQFSARRVEVQKDGQTLVLERVTGKDGKDVWRNGAGKDVDEGKVDELVNALSNLKTQRFETRVDPALKTPTLVVTVNFTPNKDDNRREVVTLARSGASAVATRPDEPGVLQLEGEMPLEPLVKAVDALK